jgi:hypothetical protein
MAEHRCSVDDMAWFTSGLHFRQEGADSIEDAVDIDLENLAPFRIGQFSERLSKRAYAGIVAENIDRPEPFTHRFLGRGRQRYVQVDAMHHLPSGIDVVAGFRKRFHIDIGEHHPAAGGAKGTRHGKTYPGCTAGYKDAFVR